uniref:Ubiquitin-like domain-containing protein n=1 Tax=Hyaloperonospora arabidopsidis (strain Emoy2) TaxID=559515 RepID=M4BF18_HYAAE
MQHDEAKLSRSLPGGWLESGHGAVAVYVKDFRDPLERRKKLVLHPWASIKDIKNQLQVVFNVPSNAQKLFYQGRELKNAHNLQQCGIHHDNAVVDFVARRPQNVAMMYTQKCDEGRGFDASNRRNNGEGCGSKRAAGCQVNNNAMPNLRPEQMPVVNIHPYGVHLLPVVLLKILHQVSCNRGILRHALVCVVSHKTCILNRAVKALQGLALGLAPVLAMDGTGGTYFFKDPSHRNVGCFKPQDEEPFGPNNPRGLVGQLGQSGLRRGILSGEACERELAAYILDKDHFAGVPATSLVESRHPVFNYTGSVGALHFKMGSLQEFLQKPLSVEDRAYVLSLSAQEDADRLAKRIPLRRACRRNMIIAGMVVQQGVRADLTLYEIARTMCREDLDAPSTLEQLCTKAFCQLHIVKQRKENEKLVHHGHMQSVIKSVLKTSDSAAEERRGSDPIDISPLPRAGFRNLRVSIDSSSLQESSSSFRRSPVADGARSPPGFWASYAPFSLVEGDENSSRGSSKHSALNGVLMHHEANRSDEPRLLHLWDKMASHALSNAVQYAKVEHTGSSVMFERATTINGHKYSITGDGARSLTCSFIGAEDDKDEFEVLNDELDHNVQDENLFLSILSRLIDDQIEEVKWLRSKERS